MKMSIEERAKQYIDLLKKDRSDNGIQNVIDKMNQLVYSDSRKPVSERYKLDIIDEMEKLVNPYDICLEHTDNASLLALIQAVRAKIEANKRS